MGGIRQRSMRRNVQRWRRTSRKSGVIETREERGRREGVARRAGISERGNGSSMVEEVSADWVRRERESVSVDILPRGWAGSERETGQQGRRMQGQEGVACCLLDSLQHKGSGGREGAHCFPQRREEVKDGDR